MGSNYLAADPDFSSIPASLQALASDIVDGYLKRPEGLVYKTDANQNPYCMAAASARMTFKLASAISLGSSVTVSVTPAIVKPDLVGEILVLDNGVGTIGEACIVAATSGTNQITLANVQFAHASGALAQTGLVITEDRSLPNKRSVARMARWPVGNVLSLLGRYAYGRRSDQVGGLYQEMNLLASVQTFGGPPEWIPIAVTQASWSDETGDIWVPAGMLMAYYSDVRIKYVAGYSEGNLPDPVVQATGQIANALSNLSEFSGSTKMIAAGDTRLQRFSATALDDDIRRMLDPFKARTMF